VGHVFAVYAESFNPDDPLSGLVVGERPEPGQEQALPDGWTTITVKAASLNHHDLFSLRGVGLKQEQLPMILGTDAAGLDEDGNEVVVHAVISSPGWEGATRAPWPSGSQCPAATWCRSRPPCPSRRRPACRPPGSRRTECSSAGAS
jgi:hypothetical protein